MIMLCYIRHDMYMLHNTPYVRLCYITHDMYMLYKTCYVI